MCIIYSLWREKNEVGYNLMFGLIFIQNLRLIGELIRILEILSLGGGGRRRVLSLFWRELSVK